jgi:hypothetical protein
MTTLDELLARWRTRHIEWAKLRVFVDGEQLAAQVIADLEELESASDDILTLREASRLGGYSADRLQHLVAVGEIENVGQKQRPRIRRCDVPIKPGYGATDRVDARRAIVREVIDEETSPRVDLIVRGIDSGDTHPPQRQLDARPSAA